MLQFWSGGPSGLPVVFNSAASEIVREVLFANANGPSSHTNAVVRQSLLVDQ